MANRGPGEGTVFQRQDGRWQASLMIGRNRRTVYGKTKAEARAKLAELRRQASAGTGLPEAGRRTVADLATEWLAAADLKPSTKAHHQLVLKTYVLPALGNVRLSRLEPSHLQRLYAGLSPSVADKAHRVLHRALEVAVRWKWIGANPADRVLRPAYRTERRSLWTADQLRTFVAGTEGHWLHPFWSLAIVTGCRSGELRALTWDEVDLEAGTITVGQTLHRLDGQYIVTAPKSEASVRTLAVGSEGLRALRRQRAQQAEWRLRAGPAWEGTDFVFTTRAGAPLHRSTPLNALKRECRRLGVPTLAVHDLRHTSASLLLSQGLPVPLVSQRLGHANPSITMSVYAHVIGADDGAAAAAITKALAR
ncbi:MAG: site-specific integrase [Anaerolineae bacterium]|nr:site-specific integrase [Anaerolineae bacterium]